MQPIVIAVTLLLSATVMASAQGQSPTPAPAPGPTNPVPPNPQAQPGATIVINPTQDECQRGWSASMRWTQEQFREFCTKLGASK
jgi:hypothetical protein